MGRRGDNEMSIFFIISAYRHFAHSPIRPITYSFHYRTKNTNAAK